MSKEDKSEEVHAQGDSISNNSEKALVKRQKDVKKTEENQSVVTSGASGDEEDDENSESGDDQKLIDYDPKTVGPILPNGEINWECPCLGGAAHGPCGTEFRAAFSCFHYR